MSEVELIAAMLEKALQQAEAAREEWVDKGPTAWGIWMPGAQEWLQGPNFTSLGPFPIYAVSSRGVAAAQAEWLRENAKCEYIPARFQDDGTPHPDDLAAANPWVLAQKSGEFMVLSDCDSISGGTGGQNHGTSNTDALASLQRAVDKVWEITGPQEPGHGATADQLWIAVGELREAIKRFKEGE